MQDTVNSYFGWFQDQIAGLSDLIKKFADMLRDFIDAWHKKFELFNYTDSDA